MTIRRGGLILAPSPRGGNMKLFLIIVGGVLLVGSIILYLKYYSALEETRDLFNRRYK